MKGLSRALVLGLLAAAVGIATRPLLPIDETRYASVAWEMFTRGSWLVPHLNGAPYSDKPPLLFWCILAGWHVVGPSGIWLRAVAPLFGLAALALTARLARATWPDRPLIADLAPLVLAGTAVWTVYATLTLFDTLLTCAVLVGMLALKRATTGAAGWLLFGVAVTFGLFAKGPVILLHLLPVALLAPWWRQDRPNGGWLPWYGGLAAAVLTGAGVVLLWAIPAGRAGGPEYQRAILFGQTTGRVVNAFAHRRPFWWYLPLVPLLLLPWLVTPPVWRALGTLRRAGRDDGVRFCLAWTLPVFVCFSLVSGKQIHYLLPLLPAVALLVSAALERGSAADAEGRGPATAWRTASWAAAVAVLMIVVVHVGASGELRRRYEFGPVAAQAAALEQAGRPIAHVGRYSGQYHWLGRLAKPFSVLDEGGADAWLAAHPDGAVISEVSGPCSAPADGRVAATGRWERRTVCLVEHR